MDIVKMVFKILIITYPAGPESFLPKGGTKVLAISKGLSKPAFDNAPTPRIVIILKRKFPEAMEVVGQQNPAFDLKWKTLPTILDTMAQTKTGLRSGQKWLAFMGD